MVTDASDAAGDRLRAGCLLAPFTTLRIGGPAEKLLEVRSMEDIIWASSYTRERSVPLWIIGRGSNLLVDSHGLPGLTLLLRKAPAKLKVNPDTGIIEAEAGVPLPRIAVEAMKCGLTGFEHFLVIPGTVGAGVAINAGVGGADGPCVADRLLGVVTLDPSVGTPQELTPERAGLRYRASAIHDSELIVLSARFQASGTSSPDAIMHEHRALQHRRIAKQPKNTRNCGSVFKAIDGVPAGLLIDQCGLKGTRIGNAAISSRHANWIENLGGAHSDDVRCLIALAQEEVLRTHGIALVREVRIFPDDSPNPPIRKLKSS